MKYITIDGMISGTGIKDTYNREWIEIDDLQLPDDLIARFQIWLKKYQKEHFSGFADVYVVESLDKEGLEICEQMHHELPEIKIEYFSAGKCKKIPIIF